MEFVEAGVGLMLFLLNKWKKIVCDGAQICEVNGVGAVSNETGGGLKNFNMVTAALKMLSELDSLPSWTTIKIYNDKRCQES